MTANNPEEVLHAFFRAFNQGDIEAILAFYEPQGVLVAPPGQVNEGHAALRESLSKFLAMKPTLILEKHSMVKAGDLALSLVKWTLNGTGADGKPARMQGTSSDVMRKQPDGRWLYVIDNPWGAGILS